MQLSPNNIQLLQALRGGRMSSEQIGERFKRRNHPAIDALVNAGLIRLVSAGGSSSIGVQRSTEYRRKKAGTPALPAGMATASRVYEITEAGLAACPPRNPASAKPRTPPPPRGANVHGPTATKVDRPRGYTFPT